MHAPEGEKMAKGILRRLKFDNDTIGKVCRLIRWHDLRPTPEMADVSKGHECDRRRSFFQCGWKCSMQTIRHKSDYLVDWKKKPVRQGCESPGR